MNIGNTKFYVNEETSTTIGGGPDNFNEIPFFESSLNTNQSFTARPWSSNFIVITKEEVILQNSPSINYSKKLVLFPNPTEGQVEIKSDYPLKQLRIFDTKGSLIFSHEGDISSVNTSNFIAGVYFFIAETEKGIISKKIIIQKTL